VVVDASVALKWVLPESGTDAALRLYDTLAETGVAVCVPDLFWLETGNTLWRLARGDAGLLTADEAREAFATLRLAPLRTEPMGPMADRVLDIALSADITTYDAAYVALAELMDARLWTADRALVGKVAGTEWEEHAQLLE
jgi:predicted nucleic acid-binding protein